MTDKSQVTAAGFIIFREAPLGLEFLGLIALEPERIRSKGVYDLPKGQLDPGESFLEGAHRECFEETGIKKKYLISNNPVISSRLSLWIAKVDFNTKIKINKNPETGELEHEGYKWLTLDQLENNCLIYLKPHVANARKIIERYYENN